MRGCDRTVPWRGIHSMPTMRSSAAFGMVALALTALGQTLQAQGLQETKEKTMTAAPSLENSPVSIQAEMDRHQPDVVLGTTRIWHLSATPQQRTAIIEMRTGLPMHRHPDGTHYLFVVDGEMTATVGGQRYELRKGMYIAIAMMIPHKYEVPAGKRIVLLSMDSPPYDPAKTDWIEAKPVKAEQ